MVYEYNYLGKMGVNLLMWRRCAKNEETDRRGLLVILIVR